MPAAREMELLCKGQPTSVPQAPRDYSHWFVSWEFCSAWDSLFFQFLSFIQEAFLPAHVHRDPSPFQTPVAFRICAIQFLLSCLVFVS